MRMRIALASLLALAASEARAADLHDYFDSLAVRTDTAAVYSLRDQNQLDRYMDHLKWRDVTYDPVRDPDPRRQDAAKVLVPSDKVSLPNNVRVPIPKTTDDSLLVVWDAWFGDEFKEFDGTYKNFQLASGRIWTEVRSDFGARRNPRVEEKYPGPKIALVDVRQYDHDFSKGPCTISGPEFDGITYSGNNIGPRVGDFVIRPETWTRYWALLKPSADYPGFYEFSLWVADEKQEPRKLVGHPEDATCDPRLRGKGVLIRPTATHGYWDKFWLEYNTSSNYVAPGRGPLTSYARNVVMLKGVDPESAGLLVKPAGSAPESITPPKVEAFAANGSSTSITITEGGTIELAASASDADGIARVDFFVGGSTVASDFSAPFEHTWSGVPPKLEPYVLAVRAYDARGWSSRSEPVLAKVGIAPEDDLEDPKVVLVDEDDVPYEQGGVYRGKLNLTAEASDDRGVAGVQFAVCDPICKDHGSYIAAPKPFWLTVDTKQRMNGPLGLKVTATDVVGKTASSLVNVVIDNALYAVGSSSVTSDGATITWYTNEPMDGQVIFSSVTKTFHQSSPLDAAMVTSHTATLTRLEPGTNYNFQVKSRNAAGALFISDWTNFIFRTLSSAEPAFRSHPRDVAVLAGRDAVFAVTAEGDLPLAYQWQSRPTGGSFADIPGAQGAAYTLAGAALSDHGREFRCVVKNGAGEATSDSARLSVTASGDGTPPRRPRGLNLL